MHFLVSKRRRLIALSLLSSLAITIPVATAQRASDPTAIAPTKTETVEWVYRIRYGFHDEWFQIFQKYQIAILERQKQLGYVKDYTIWAPSLHTSEDSRWDYRIVITRASHDVPNGQSESDIARQLFPDQAAYRRDENRRWELTTNHWDLPIHLVSRSTTE